MFVRRKLSRWRAFIWLWRHQPQERKKWIVRFLLGADLRSDVFL